MDVLPASSEPFLAPVQRRRFFVTLENLLTMKKARENGKKSVHHKEIIGRQ